MSHVSCPTCRAQCRRTDEACGSCGAALARLVVHQRREPIDHSTTSVVVEIENSGVVDAAFVLRRIDARRFGPGARAENTSHSKVLGDDGAAHVPWLIGGPLFDQPVELPAGARVPVRFDIDPSRLPQPGDSIPSRVVVPLVTSLVRYDPQRRQTIRRVLAVELATAGRLVVSPSRAVSPFVGLEQLDTFEHTVVVSNAGGHALTVTNVAVDVTGPLQVQPLLLTSGAVIAPGASVTVALRCAAAGNASAAVVDGPVPAEVVLRVATDDGAERTASLVLTLGRGPTVVVIDNPVIHTRGRQRRAAVTMHNPGQRPVQVQAHLKPQAVDDGDWLRLLLTSPVVIGPGERCEVPLLAVPEARSDDHLDTPWGERTLVLEHDGWPADVAARTIEVPLTVELGRTRILEEATLGVDFGTSNSSVAMFHGPTGTLHALPLDISSGRESLASLMFFNGPGRGGAGVDGFLFGAAAENAAPQNFTNLVRQLKSVVARAPDTDWNFIVDDDSQQARVSKHKTQALLNHFFVEMKRRAEDGLRALPLAFLSELDLVDLGVRFKHAVFSHPVGVDDAMLRALHAAVRDCGLTELDFEAFKHERCIDEALAAVLAWVYLAATLPEAQLPLHDDERLLCFDAGGGTCDVAAVTVSNLATFRRRPGAAGVDVELLANGGDPRFGGTDIDRLLASWLLDEVQALPEGHALDVDSMRRALFYPSYEAWRRARGDVEPDHRRSSSRAVFQASAEVLRAAERVKKTLSEASGTTWVALTADWPRRANAGGSSVGRVEVSLTRARFEAVCQAAFAGAAALIDPVIDAAGWRADDVTTLLFTGQTSRIPALRQAVTAQLLARRSPDAPPPTIIEPGRFAAFDVKRCVAQGAAILGDSRRGGGGWLHITRRSTTALSATWQVRRGPLLIDVVGLEAGRPLPARGIVDLGAPATRLVLYRSGQPALECTWATPAVDVVVVAEAEGVVAVVVGDERHVCRRVS